MTAAVALVGFALLSACAGEHVPDEHPVSAAIARAIHAQPDTILDLRELTEFHWSRVHVFRPYVSEREVAEGLGFPWRFSSPVLHNDDRALVVFVDSGRVVAAFDQVNSRGNMMAVEGHAGFPPDSACFHGRAAGVLSDGSANVELIQVACQSPA